MVVRDFAEEIRNEFREVQQQDAEVAVVALKQQITALKRDRTEAHKQTARLRELFDAIQRIEAEHNKPPAWAIPKRRGKHTHTGTLSLLLSDLHLDEVVDPAEIEGLNCYNREIALQRLNRTAEKTIMLARNYISGVTYDGLSLMLGGDLYSGFIHEELAETNECSLIESVEFWLNPLAAMIGMFADEFGHVHVSGVVGNHSRLSRKPRMKRRVTDNVDWLTYRLLMRDFAGDDRITWQIPYSADTTVTLYHTDYLFTHGDQFKGGGGVAGVLSPLRSGATKKAVRSMHLDRSWDYMVCGHWHQIDFFKNVIVNGSLKGYDEFAYMLSYEYEDAQQALWLTTPEHGITTTMKIVAQDRKREGW